MSIQAPDPSALLMGGSNGKTAKLSDHGDKVRGEIVSVETTQQTDLDGNPKTWDDGKPMWQVVVALQTDERDPDDPDDDGIRKVYLKGSAKYASTATAARDAVKAAGATRLEVGGTFGLAYTGDGEPSKRGFSAPKLYAATYTPPVAGADLGGVWDD